jgi:hypothetical protein
LVPFSFFTPSLKQSLSNIAVTTCNVNFFSVFLFPVLVYNI